MNTITIRLTREQLDDCLTESSTFRLVIADQMLSDQSELSKQSFPHETVLLANLERYIKTNATHSNKISCIKYVRQWAADNKQDLSTAAYENLYSLHNAKEYVEKFMGLPRW